jgi:hypothetical protein
MQQPRHITFISFGFNHPDGGYRGRRRHSSRDVRSVGFKVPGHRADGDPVSVTRRGLSNHGLLLLGAATTKRSERQAQQLITSHLPLFGEDAAVFWREKFTPGSVGGEFTLQTRYVDSGAEWDENAFTWRSERRRRRGTAPMNRST